MLPRLDRNLPKEATKLQRSLAEYLRNNVLYTSGSFNFRATFQNLRQEVVVERTMSRSITRSVRWRKPARSCNLFRSATSIALASFTATPKNCSACNS
jgi:hypothetical protein